MSGRELMNWIRDNTFVLFCEARSITSIYIYVFEQHFYIIYHPVVGKNGHKNVMFLIIN